MPHVFDLIATAVFSVHLVFVLLMVPSTVLFVLGAYRALPLVWGAHVVAVGAMALGQALLLECPLVPLEHWLREAAGVGRWYEGSFTVFVVRTATGLELPPQSVTALSLAVMAATGAALLGTLAASLGRGRPAARA